MPHQQAPWLEGLDEAWVAPISSATHDASYLPSSQQRPPRSNSNHSLPRMSPHASQRKRSPLSDLNNNEGSLDRLKSGTLKSAGSRSFSGASGGSVVRYDTVQMRSKSTSPAKSKGTLEWKRRLVLGEVGYGDQTDLFGPSGLENLFSQSRDGVSSGRKIRGPHRPSRSDLTSSAVYPSSPPMLPHAGKTLSRTSLDTPRTNGDYSGDATVTQHKNPRKVTISECIKEESSPKQSQSSLISEEPHDSKDTPEAAGAAMNETICGPTELEQEDFSPVFISKHTAKDGKVDYKALNAQLIGRMQSMSINQPPPETISEEQDEEHDVSVQSLPEINPDVPYSDFEDGSSIDPASGQDFSLSENLPTGTPPVIGLGRHVELQRGGYSRYGSFKQRLLSPSQSTNGSSRLPSGATSSARRAQNIAPQSLESRRPSSRMTNQTKQPLTSSPLKLFGPHDTFTNNRLLRRMSQFNSDEPVKSSASKQDQRLSKGGEKGISDASHKLSSLSFGSGELDEQPFDADIHKENASNQSVRVKKGKRTENSNIRKRLSTAPKSSPSVESERPGRGVAEVEIMSSVRIKPHRNESTPSTEQTKSQFNKAPNWQIDEAVEPAKGTQKRPPNSPFKPPTPKRRRTLHASEVFEDASVVHHTQISNADSDRDKPQFHDKLTIEDGNVSVQIHLQRPRTPTPTQQRKTQIEAEIREATEEFVMQEPEKLEAVIEHLESSIASGSPSSLQEQARVVAREVAKFTLRVQRPSGEITERKRSVTTQDFYNEAVMVMKLIREKAGRQSALGSVEESNGEDLSEVFDVDCSQDDLSSLRVSRPPSREGGSRWRPRTSEQTDEKLLKHLRQFAEKDDTEFIAPTPNTSDTDLSYSDNVIAEDKESNVRIRAPSQHLEKDAFHTHDRVSPSASFPTGASTSERLNTSSTRKSDNVGTLAPGAVAHLIGEQVGSMTFDKEKNQWIRVKSSPHKARVESFLELPSNVTSDDDPFREISDLPVDEVREEEIRKISCGQRPSSLGGPGVAEVLMASQQPGVESRAISQETVLAWSAPIADAKPLPERQNMQTAEGSELGSDDYAASVGDELDEQSESEHQFMSDASDSLRMTAGKTTSASIEDDDPLDLADSPRLKHTERQPAPADDVDEGTIELLTVPTPGRHHSDHLLPPRHTGVSFNLTREPSTQMPSMMSEAFEHTELSIMATMVGDRMTSVSMNIGKPASLPRSLDLVTESQPSPSRLDQTFLLSDLPDFSINGDDDERPSEQALARRLAKRADAEAHDQHALTVKDMVRVLADIQEDEPYWDETEKLDLHDRGLASLTGLDEFCGKIKDLDVSANSLTHLSGTPTSLRQLVAQANQINSLTSWGHLVNLQYLDISNNALEDLRGLSCLVHLRELRADDNAVTTLQGIDQLDGLLGLSLRNNRLRQIEFQDCRLQRLEALDLRDNGISAIDSLASLTKLSTLRLDGNVLGDTLRIDRELRSLRTLSLNDCGLKHLDLSCTQALQHLYVDGNSLSAIIGIELLKSLDCLSMRNQHLPPETPLSIFSQTLHARKVCVSENRIPTLDLQQGLLSLQHLEIASVGLQCLPDDFGMRLPNLCSLNLNFNAIKDIRPLLNIQKLERLRICGNRLTRLRQSMATLARIPTLTEVDLRDNPLTQSFYAPPAQGVRHPTQGIVPQRESEARRGTVAVGEMQEWGDDDEVKYTLLPGDIDRDQQHAARLDDDTKLRKKVYHLLLAESCARLVSVDGSPFDLEAVRRRDAIWHRLVELGIAKKIDT